MRFYSALLSVLLLSPLSQAAFAQGGAAVIALEMPPPGESGYGALQTGGAIPSGPASLYYNPALLSEIGAATGTRLQFSRSREDLNVGNGQFDFAGAALVIPDNRRGFDAGFAYTRTHLDFGPGIPPPGVLPTSFSPHETVHALGAAVRLGSPVSVGGAAKFYDSRLWTGSSGRAQGWAFDVGVLALQRFRPFAFDGFHSLDVAPSAGLAFVNLGPDVVYDVPENSDPLPSLRRTSLGLNLRLADVVDIAWGADWEMPVHRRAGDARSVETYGYSIWTLGYRFSRGQLEDRDGERSEVHTAQSFELSLLQVHRIIGRARSGDFRSPSEVFDGGYPLPPLKVLGFDWRPNPRVVIGNRRIHDDEGARDGQEGWYWSVSL